MSRTGLLFAGIVVLASSTPLWAAMITVDTPTGSFAPDGIAAVDVYIKATSTGEAFDTLDFQIDITGSAPIPWVAAGSDIDMIGGSYVFSTAAFAAPSSLSPIRFGFFDFTPIALPTTDPRGDVMARITLQLPNVLDTWTLTPSMVNPPEGSFELVPGAITTIPEPSTLAVWGLLVMGAAGMAAGRQRKRRPTR